MLAVSVITLYQESANSCNYLWIGIMEYLGLVIFLAVIAAIAFAIYYFASAAVTEKRKTYERLAAEYGGSCELPGWFSPGSLKVTCGGSALDVSNWSTGDSEGGTAYTRIQSPVAQRQLVIHVEGRNLLSSVLQSVGLSQNLPTGDAAFDDLFAVSSNQPDAAKAFLSAAARTALREIQSLRPHCPVQMSVEGGWLEVNVGVAMESYDELKRYIELTSAIVPAKV